MRQAGREKAGVSSPADESPKTGEGAALSATAVKWLIPSVPALLALVGYVAQTAQESLIGVGDGRLDAGKYTRSAAGFLEQVITTLIDLVLGRSTMWLGGNAMLLIAVSLAAAVAVIALWLPRQVRARLPARAIAYGRPAAAVLLVGAVVLKFAVLDLPLTKLENVVLDLGETISPGAQQARAFAPTEERLSLLVRAQDEQGGIRLSSTRGDAPGRAESLLAALVCSRVGPPDSRPDGSANEYGCRRDRETNYERLSGEFLAHLWFGGIIAALAIALLRRGSNSPALTLVGALALAYLLTLPHAYGKLLKSTYFDFGEVQVSEALAKAAPPVIESNGDRGPSGAEAPAAEDPDALIYALVLSRSAATVDLLGVREIPCRGGGASGSTVKLSSINASHVLSVEEIYRQDVIAWTTQNTRHCAPLGNPYGAPIR